MGIIPFSRSVFVSPDDPFVTSADFLTEGVLGPAATWGLGTNVISDIYVDFGLLGVILLMFIMGRWSSFVSFKVSKVNCNIRWFVIYLFTLALYSQYARYSFDFPIRNIAWTYFMFVLVAMMYKKGSKL